MTKKVDPGIAHLLGNSRGPVARTRHETIFSACSVAIVPTVNELGVVIGFLLEIADPHENRYYRMGLNETSLETLAATIHALPREGEKVGGNADSS